MDVGGLPNHVNLCVLFVNLFSRALLISPYLCLFQQIEIMSQIEFASMLKNLFENTDILHFRIDCPFVQLIKNNKTSQNIPEEVEIVSLI